MAYADGYTGDANQGIGQGVAFVLPESKSATYAMQLAQTHASQLQLFAKNVQTQKLREQAQYQKDFQSYQLPDAYAPFDKELNNRFTKWQSDAAGFHATTGKSPFTDPDMMKKYNDDILVPAKQSQQVGKDITKLMSDVDLDRDNKYSEASKKEVKDYYENLKNHPFETLNKPIPVLKEREIDAHDFIKPLKPTGDDNHNQAQVYSQMYEPSYTNFLSNRYHILTDGTHPLLDFGLYPHDRSGAVYEKRDFHTDPEGIKWIKDDILQHPDDPTNAQHIKEYGWDLSKNPDGTYKDHKIEERITHAIQDSNITWGNAVKDLSKPLYDTNQAELESDRKFDRTMKVKSYNLQVQEHNDLQGQRMWAREHQKQANQYSTLILNGSDAERNNTYASLKKLYQSNPSYRAPLDIQDDGNSISITVPPKMKKNPAYVPGLKSKFNQEFIQSEPGYKIPAISKDDEQSVNSAIFEVLRNVGAQNMKSNNQAQSGKAAPTSTQQEKKQSSLKSFDQF